MMLLLGLLASCLAIAGFSLFVTSLASSQPSVGSIGMSGDVKVLWCHQMPLWAPAVWSREMTRSHILRARLRLQMLWIHARTVFTSVSTFAARSVVAFMVDEQSIRDRADESNVRPNMCQDHVASNSESTVSMRCFIREPNDTTIRASSRFRPEPFLNIFDELTMDGVAMSPPSSVVLVAPPSRRSGQITSIDRTEFRRQDASDETRISVSKETSIVLAAPTSGTCRCVTKVNETLEHVRGGYRLCLRRSSA